MFMQRGVMQRSQARLVSASSLGIEGWSRCVSVGAVGVTMEVSSAVFCKPMNPSMEAPCKLSEEQRGKNMSYVVGTLHSLPMYTKVCIMISLLQFIK